MNAGPVTHNNIRPTSEDARHGGVSNVKTILHVGGSSKRGEWRTDGELNIMSTSSCRQQFHESMNMYKRVPFSPINRHCTGVVVHLQLEVMVVGESSQIPRE